MERTTQIKQRREAEKQPRNYQKHTRNPQECSKQKEGIDGELTRKGH